MRRSRLISTLTAAAIAGGLCLTAPSALAAPIHADRSSQSTSATGSKSHAVNVLHRAQSLFGVRSATTTPTPLSTTKDAAAAPARVDATLTLVALSRVLHDLAGADRAAAKAILARPTIPADGDYAPWNSYDIAAGAVECGPNVCVNYTTNNDPVHTDGNNPDLTRDSESIDLATAVLDKTTGNGVPDQVDETLATMEHVWSFEVDTLGYNVPKPDGGAAATFNTDPTDQQKFDVYLSNIGVLGLYGYCAPDVGARQSSGYCVLDNNYSVGEFGTANTPLDNLRVTAAHEFFHAIQFGYDAWEDTWFMESTAAWMEDEVYPSVNDNLQYLNFGPMQRPGQPMDFISRDYLTSYGSWVFIRYLSNHFQPGLIRTAWANAVGGAGYSVKAIASALTARHTDFATQFANFEAANSAPSVFYDADGKRYAKYAAKPVTTLHLSPSVPTSGWLKSTRVKHISAIRLGAVPTAAAGHLSVEVKGPIAKTTPRAEVVVHLKNGGATRRAINLVNGAGTLRGIPFGKSKVTRVDVILINASIRYSCNLGTSWACGGYPTDDSSIFRVRVTRTA